MIGEGVIYKHKGSRYAGVIKDKVRTYVTGCSTNEDNYIIIRVGEIDMSNDVTIDEYQVIDKIQPGNLIQLIKL